MSEKPTPLDRPGSDAGRVELSDPRALAFCSTEHPEVFHAVASRSDVWRDDPFDVETIHEEARSAFQRLVHRASNVQGASTGRILLLQGEAGSGKTHLMRAFRNWTHGGGLGYCGYMQMTSATSHYGRYILNNLIDSLDQPYHSQTGEISGLLRLSTLIAESPRGIAIDRLDQIRNDELDFGCLARLIDALADQVVLDDRFNHVDIDLVRALLYLQSNDPRIKGRVLKYLRCEPLSTQDQELLGGITPRQYDDAPQWLIQRLGELMAWVGSVPLVLCVDQIEDIYNQDDAPVRFRRAMATLCDLASRIPSAIVVISCLEQFYTLLRGSLTNPLVDRIESDPAPVRLKVARESAEIEQLVSLRMRFLCDELEAPFQEEAPTYPFPRDYLSQLSGMRTRDVLARCQEYRERCVAARRLVELDSAQTAVAPPPADHSDATRLEQLWNDLRSDAAEEIPTENAELALVLGRAIRDGGLELETGHWFETEVRDRIICVERHAQNNSVALLTVGLCNGTARGGHLGKLIKEVEEQAGELIPVIVRSTAFPASPTAAVSKQVGLLVARGGRRVVVEDSDWRTMIAFRRFKEHYEADPGFSAWLKEAKPLTRLNSIREILDLSQLRAITPVEDASIADPMGMQSNALAGPESEPQTESGPESKSEAQPKPEPAPRGPLVIGHALDRSRNVMTLEPAELTRHVAFLGGTGSGKTTLAMNLVEQLLLQGTPVILVDRKGDLCGYANDEAWRPSPDDDPERVERRGKLRERVDVAVYTPGNPQGRPLSITIAPAGLGLIPSYERGQIARYAASALAGMMNYGAKGADTARQAVLAHAIELLAGLEPAGTVSLPALIEYIDEKDPALVNVVGRLDTKQFERLVQDLETLRLSRGDFLAAQGEPLDPDELLGLGRHALPGKTRLSVISTKFIGATQDVQFWVSQLLVEMGRWISRSPSGELKAVLMFDEADLYLPANRKPPTKEPMENLLKRARSAGLGLFLATQSPGDFDYKCRENIRSWFLGRVKEAPALAKIKPMLADSQVDAAKRLPSQEAGEFHLVRDGSVQRLKAQLAAILPEQLPEETILALARATHPLTSPTR